MGFYPEEHTAKLLIFAIIGFTPLLILDPVKHIPLCMGGIIIASFFSTIGVNFDLRFLSLVTGALLVIGLNKSNLGSSLGEFEDVIKPEVILDARGALHLYTSISILCTSRATRSTPVPMSLLVCLLTWPVGSVL